MGKEKSSDQAANDQQPKPSPGVTVNVDQGGQSSGSSQDDKPVDDSNEGEDGSPAGEDESRA